MDGAKLGSKRVGSINAAVNFYDDKKPSSRTKELHRARRDIGRYKESKWTAESAKAQAESELSNAKKTANHLSSMIEESNYKAKTQMRDVERLEKWGKGQHGTIVVAKRNENFEYAQVMRELEYLKKELFKLKLDVAYVMEQKSRAEKEIEASNSKMLSCLTTAEELRREIEEANEEQVLAELARIEASKELTDIETQRKQEANEFSFKLESTRRKLKEAIEEIDESKELEMKLAVTILDVDFLQNELKSVKEMDKRVQGDGSAKQLEGRFKKGEESEDSIVLQTITEELEAARKELGLVREEGFQFMASLDVIRNELKHVTAETDRLKKKEGKVDSTVQNLNFKILRAKSKLEAVSAAEEKARSIVMSLSHTLEKLKTETEEAKKENEDVSQEVAATKEEIQKVELDIDMTEERLQGVMQELEVAKASEALALEKLKTLTESTMRERALTAQHSSMITISKFEYEYLTYHAASAEEIADKKVAAAEAWIEALKASEKEILMETKIAQRELKESKLEQELEVYTKEKMLSRRVSSSEELDNWPRKREKSSSKNFQRALSRKSIKLNGTITPARGAKFQKTASPAARHISPFTIKKRKKVILLLKSCLLSKTTLTDTFLVEKPYLERFNKIKLAPLDLNTNGSGKINIKIMQRKSNGKILFAQGKEDFANFLFSFLTFPLGAVVQLLECCSSIGSVDALYKSIVDLDEDYWTTKETKHKVVHPVIAPQFKLTNQLLPICDAPIPEYFCFTKDVYDERDCQRKLISWFLTSQRTRTKRRTETCKGMKFVDPISESGKGEGFAKGPTMYMATDDLVVTPMSSDSLLSLLNRTNILVRDLEEKEVSIGVKEGISILQASLSSTSALTAGLSHLLTKIKEEN